MKTNTYSPGHPWYYVLGGKAPPPKRILEAVKRRGYKGYREADIAAAAEKPEPARSHALREIRAQVMADLRYDLSVYRRVVRELRQYRERHPAHEETPRCENVHTSVSLKHNHVFNALAHVLYLDELLSSQPDLFGF